MLESSYSKMVGQIAGEVESAAAKEGYDASGAASMISMSKGFGDISCSVSFKISKMRKESPVKVAERIASSIDRKGYIREVTTENGYLNFHLDRRSFSEDVLREASAIGPGDAVSMMGGEKRVIIEYPSANPMHPIHVGHLRNMVIGDTIARLHDACGYSMEREDYIDDLGLQMMMAVWGYMRNGSAPSKKFDHWLGDVYAEANTHAEEPGFRERLSELAKAIEHQGTEESKLAREIAERCVRAQYQTAANYGSNHDVLIWESDILREKLLDNAMRLLVEKGFLTKATEGEYRGCIILDLNTIENLPNEFKGLKENVKVLVRNDGTPTYVAKDIAFHMWKFGMLPDTFKYEVFIDRQGNGRPVYTSAPNGKRMEFGHVSEAINIIDVKQNYPQALLKLAFKHIGRNDIADGIRHLSYGRVELEKGTLAARKGISVENTADGLLEEAEERAISLIGERLRLSKDEQKTVAKSVALSAIKFAFLRVAPEKWITFSWKWALNFEGDSGPYCQYMHARASRLIEDSGAGIDGILGAGSSGAWTDQEFALIKSIAVMREVVEKACTEYRPNLITEYATELAGTFSKFYDSSPILKAESEKERMQRLALVLGFRSAIREALWIIGIDALDRM